MTVRKPWLVVLSVLAVIVAYSVLIHVYEWLRIKAGVGSDTATPIDLIAWQGCIFCAAIIAGVLASGVLRSAGMISLFGMLGILGMCFVLNLNDCGRFTIMDSVDVLKTLAFPVLSWIVFSGFATGWVLSTNQNESRKAWIALAVFVGASVSLALVFYPMDRYFMSIWGNG
ncbi:MAG: hypothetical protein ACYC0V_08155 [Armatimonadota bacterium]